MQYPFCCTSINCGETRCPATCENLPTLRAYQAWRDDPKNRAAAQANRYAAANATDYVMEPIPGLMVEPVRWNRPKQPKPIVEQKQLALDGAALGPLFA